MKVPHGPGRFRFVAGVCCLLAVAIPSCSRGTVLGDNEAIEILVLDGVERPKAECIISSLDGAIDLERVTGISPDLTDNEIALLARTSATCAIEVEGSDAVNSGPGLPEEPDDLERLPADVDERIDGLVAGGLNPVLAECLRAAVMATPDPAIAVADFVFLSEAILICEQLDADGS